MENIIEVNDVAKVFGNERALSSVSFEVKRGEIFGFLGPSGAGKTTMIKILTGQLPQTAGKVKVFQTDVSILKEAAARKQFGVLTDNSGLYDRLSIEDNLLFYCDLYDVAKGKVDEVLDLVQLKEEKKKRVANLSKGMRQRVTLALCIIFIDYRPVNMGIMIAAFILSAVFYISLGTLIGLFAKTIMEASVYSFPVIGIFSVGSYIRFLSEQYPILKAAHYLPNIQLIDIATNVEAGHGLVEMLPAFAIILAWSALTIIVTVILFKHRMVD